MAIKKDVLERESFFQTYTQPAEKANEFAENIANELIAGKYEYTDIGDFYPIIMNNKLYYTFTIRAGFYT